MYVCEDLILIDVSDKVIMLGNGSDMVEGCGLICNGT